MRLKAIIGYTDKNWKFNKYKARWYSNSVFTSEKEARRVLKNDYVKVEIRIKEVK